MAKVIAITCYCNLHNYCYSIDSFLTSIFAIEQLFRTIYCLSFNMNFRPHSKINYHQNIVHSSIITNLYNIYLYLFGQDPASAIPKGTLLALLISMVSYALMVLFAGGGALRDASGNVTDLLLVNDTVVDFSGVSHCVNTTVGCNYGLHNSYSVSILVSQNSVLGFNRIRFYSNKTYKIL